MKATGSKLIKVAEAYGRDILQDSVLRRMRHIEPNIVVDIDGSLVIVKDFKEAFNYAGKNQAPMRFEDASKTDSRNTGR